MITTTRAPKLKIRWSTLVIHYENLIKKLGDLNVFKSIGECNLITNKEIVVISNMMWPSLEFSRIIQEILLPSGLKLEQDFALVNEQLINDVGDPITDLLNQKIPDLLDIDWLSSEITLKGNVVWLNDSNILKNEVTDEYWIKQLHEIQRNRRDYLAGRRIQIVKDLGDRFQIHQEGVKNGCLYVSKDFIRHFFDEIG
jgi:hypothetical protein